MAYVHALNKIERMQTIRRNGGRAAEQKTPAKKRANQKG